jgi:hypothetical protein
MDDKLFFCKMDISQVAKSLDGNICPTNHPLLILYGHGFHVTLHVTTRAQELKLYLLTHLANANHVL